MAFLTFRGGVHPYDGKELSKEKPVREFLPGKELVYPLSQHIGAPAQPVVKKGDYVLAGQKIAEMGGFVSAPVHASVSGTVKEIKKVRNNVGAMVDAIVIENDEKYENRRVSAGAVSRKSHKRGNYSQNQRGRRSRYGRSRFPYPCKAFSKRTG